MVLAGCCIRKPPAACEWVVSASSESLIDAIERAEEISIRHGDARPYGAVRRTARERCESDLFAAIASDRRIGIDQVREARRELDHRPFDWLVNVPMALFTLAAAFVMTRMVRQRFDDDRVARLVAIVLVSVGLGVLVIGIGQVWAFAIEGVRIGNDHLGYRGLRIPWGKHRAATFTLAVLATWFIAAMPSLRTHPSAPLAPGTNP